MNKKMSHLYLVDVTFNEDNINHKPETNIK